MILDKVETFSGTSAAASGRSAGWTNEPRRLGRFGFVLAVAISLQGLWGAASSAEAAVITTNELALDGIFSQPSFQLPVTTPVDIRFNPSLTVSNPTLTDITTGPQLTTLFGLNLTPPLVLSMFFVDTLDFCGGFNVSIIGCAQTNGPNSVVESAFAANMATGPELNAHEIAHNLGLNHTGGPNLMNGTINGSTALTPAQAMAILGSGFVQTDPTTQARFVSITPILISSVPLPAAGLLLFSGLLGLFWVRRRQSVKA